MSRYSDKCDFADFLDIFGEESISKSEIYIGDKKLEATGYRDLVPYLAHTVSLFSGSKEGHIYVQLSERSYVDTQEEETLGWYLRDLLKIYNRCKRNKVPFDVDSAVKEVSFSDYNMDVIMELAKRVRDYGNKTTTAGIHTWIGEQFRKNLAYEMIKHNIDPSEYGLERFKEGK